MCGIVGYNGEKPATPILLDGLAKLEYRGYDSAGIALGGKNIDVHKTSGRLSVLEQGSRFGIAKNGLLTIRVKILTLMK